MSSAIKNTGQPREDFAAGKETGQLILGFNTSTSKYEPFRINAAGELVVTTGPGGGGGGGVVQQGARDVTAQEWDVRFLSAQPINLQQISGTALTLGQKAMAASLPVVIASDQTVLNVDVTDEDVRILGRVKIHDGVDVALVTAVGELLVNVGGTISSLPLPAGAATEATLATRLAEATFTARINTQGQKAMAGSTPVVIASDQSTLTIGGTITANQVTGQGKTLLFGVIAQSAAGTTALVAADVAAKIKVVSYVFVMSVLGTTKFTDGTVDLTGAMDIATNGGVSAIGQPSAPLFETAAINRPLNIVTTLGAARGHFTYFKEA